MAKNRYEFLLANLLDIDNNDSTLSCKVNNEKYFDVYKIAGDKTFDQLCQKANFTVQFGEYGHKDLIQKVKNATSAEEIETQYKEFSLEFPEESRFALNKDFEKEKKKMVISLESRFQRSITKWKKILKKAQDINIETNIWPLHLGFFFVCVSTEKKDIFAPLFFKEVNIEIKNSLTYLKSTGDIKVNSKLVTFLQQVGYSLDTSNYDFSNKSINDVFYYFRNSWNQIYTIPNSFKSKIPFPEEIETNSNISIYPGLILGFFNVSSGYLWNQMKKIIENDELDEILATNFNKNIYRNKIDDVIFNKHFKLFKIQETNFSQDCATVSALYQDTVIWGPPGTGKSQTISNLITNILARDYTALVVSQKRAALEVLRSRLKELGIFAIFILNDKNWKLDKFYEPLRDFVAKIENFNSTGEEDNFEIMPRDAKRYVSLAKEVKKIPDYKNVIDAYATMSNAELDEQTLNDLKRLDPYIKYQLRVPDTDFASIAAHLYEVNKNKKANSIIRMTNSYPKNIKDAAEIISQNKNLLKVDIDRALKYINTVDVESLKLVDQFFKYQLKIKTVEVNNSKTLTKMLIKRTVDKMSTFTEEEQKLYRAFTLSIRAASMKPFKFLHKHKEMIKKLFSIIVATPDTDLSIWEKNEFDYAILDESSQIFLEKGIPILYLAKRKVLAGDDQQMQPTKWFSASYAVEEDEDFGNIESLLDYALARGVYKILLDKNYRSKKASLMTFSSKNFYNSKLDVIDDYKSYKKGKPIEVIETDGYWDNSLNQKEGDIALKIVAENLRKYKKIILLVFNAKQQEYIFNRIYSEYPSLENALNEEKLSLKNIENIQGDEADLVVISVVYDKNTSLNGTYVARPGGKNALNVAISRAKEKIIVIKSLSADDIKITETSTKDMIILREWLRFLELNDEDKKSYIRDSEHDDWTQTLTIDVSPALLDEIAKTLKKEIIDKNHDLRIESDYVIGTKTLNLAIINTKLKKIVLGVMVDDYTYAGDEKQYIKFIDSFSFLKTKNYPLIILKELDWKVNTKEILDQIKAIVSENNVETVPESITREVESIHNDETASFLKEDALDSFEFSWEEDLETEIPVLNTLESQAQKTLFTDDSSEPDWANDKTIDIQANNKLSSDNNQPEVLTPEMPEKIQNNKPIEIKSNTLNSSPEDNYVEENPVDTSLLDNSFSNQTTLNSESENQINNPSDDIIENIDDLFDNEGQKPLQSEQQPSTQNNKVDTSLLKTEGMFNKTSETQLNSHTDTDIEIDDNNVVDEYQETPFGDIYDDSEKAQNIQNTQEFLNAPSQADSQEIVTHETVTQPEQVSEPLEIHAPKRPLKEVSVDEVEDEDYSNFEEELFGKPGDK